MDEIFIQQVIANNYKKVRIYFPRLSRYLINTLATNHPTRMCEVINHRNLEMLLYYFCAVVEVNSTYPEAFNYFQSCLTNEEFFNKNYLDFKDGYLYDKTFNQTYFETSLQEASIDFVMFFLEIEQGSEFDFDIFNNSVNKILNHELKKCDLQKDMYSNEYIEILYMQSLLKTLENYKELENSFKELLNNT